MVGGLEELCTAAGLAPADVDGVFHGTTSRRTRCSSTTARVAGMITTAGFRDIVHIGRHQRPLHYSVMQDIPWQARPFVERRHRKVGDRADRAADGEVLDAARRGRGARGRRASCATRASRRSRSASSSPTSTRSTSGAPAAIVREEMPGRVRHARASTSSRSSASSSASRPRRSTRSSGRGRAATSTASRRRSTRAGRRRPSCT